MNRVTSHRGPDGTGVYLNDCVSFGHNRLSIIDLSSGAGQPMKSNDGKLIIVYNGELYNFQELKKELCYSYDFKTQSDTEVVLVSYKRWGKRCVEHFNGMFSFAVWDEEKRELFLARDHAGIKPLYYFYDGKRFIFSSEIKAILEHKVPRKISKEALSLYLHLLYTPGPQTMFEGILKFPPSHTGFVRDGQFKIEPYTLDLDFNDPRKGKKLVEVIDEAVERQLVSDRKVGVYLSGGIDSSVIVDVLSRARGKVDTFSVGFDLEDNEESEKFNADFILARRTANYYKTNHHELVLSSADAIGFFEKAVLAMEEPVSNPTEIAMMTLSAFAKKYVAVALSGEGGDELFGGYERYRLSLLASIYSRLPHLLRSGLNIFEILKKANTPAGIERFRKLMFQKNDFLKEILYDKNLYSSTISDRFFSENFGKEIKLSDFERALMKIDQRTWLVDEALLRSDKMSMANGLEIRVPFLDPEVIDFSDNLPTSQKISMFNTKIALKDAYKDKLPPFILNQPKRGWFSPAAKWLRREDMKNLAKSVLSPDYYSGTGGIFNWQAVNSMTEDHISKKRYNLNIIWALMTFQIWACHYKVII